MQGKHPMRFLRDVLKGYSIQLEIVHIGTRRLSAAVEQHPNSCVLQTANELGGSAEGDDSLGARRASSLGKTGRL